MLWEIPRQEGSPVHSCCQNVTVQQDRLLAPGNDFLPAASMLPSRRIREALDAEGLGDG
jgi:hypothetical protein